MPDHAVDQYPAEWDVEWVAIDRYGRVGIFTMGAHGPIPRAYLAAASTLDQIRDAVWNLPERTASELLVAMPRPDDYEAFARRGLFAFDWRDVHRTSEWRRRYELQARPAVPMAYDETAWPAPLRPLLDRLRSRGLDFERDPAVDVGEFDCIWNQRHAV